MIAKGKAVSHGKTVIEYVLRDKKLGSFIEKNLLTSETAHDILQEMKWMQKHNSRCKNKFLRFEIGIAPDDKDKLTKLQLRDIAMNFAKKMGLEKHQWFAVTHKDSDNLHIHLIANRIGINGKVYQTDFVSNRSARAAEEIAGEMGLTIANQVAAKKRYQHPKADKTREAKKDEVRKIAYKLLGKKVGTGKDGFLSFMQELDKHGITVETMRNKQGEAYGFRFLYEGETFKASEIGREFGYRSLFRQFGLEDVKPQIGKTVVPIYDPTSDLQRSSDVSLLETVGNALIETVPSAGNLLNVHGEDYEETAFQRRLRVQQKKRRGRRM
ncbi:MAG: mobilization protein [Bacteroidia bacterium]|nr:mobilization protein [Bacteroidia bacterium]